MVVGRPKPVVRELQFSDNQHVNIEFRNVLPIGGVWYIWRDGLDKIWVDLKQTLAVTCG